MDLLDKITAALPARRVEARYSIDTWLSDYLIPSGILSYGGQQYGYGSPGFRLQQTLAGTKVHEITQTLPGYMAALRRCPPAFAAQLVRAAVMSQMRFCWRRLSSNGTDRRTFGTTALGILQHPWRNATGGELLARMEWHAGVAGNAYVVRRPDRLRVLRPDWVGILYGSEQEPDYPEHALDGELLGYVYVNQGWGNASAETVRTILPADMAHWSPQPDPECAGLGMSWLTPALRDMQLDQVASDHKIQYFRNGATPNLVVKGIPAVDRDQFLAMVDMMEATHGGLGNAYKTLYLTAGADADVVGSKLGELDMKALQGFSETRISFLSRVPAPLLGISEGLEGSSLNAGNFGMARRTFGDLWVYPTFQDVCRALGGLVGTPTDRTGRPDSELWFDSSDVPLLREDATDAAEITQLQIASIGQAVKDGFTRESAVAAVTSGNMGLLQPDPDWVSVQLQPPTNGQKPPALPTGKGA